MRHKNKGFTLAELLIVVAIIGVLVAISIPIFSKQLEKSREAVDLANLRSAYALGAAKMMTETSSGDDSDTGRADIYVYDPRTSKLIPMDDWNIMSDDDQTSAYIGKGTKTVGSGNNAFDDNSGIKYEPDRDVNGYPILAYIYWNEQRAVAQFWPE